MTRLRLTNTSDRQLLKEFSSTQGSLTLGRGSRQNMSSKNLDSPLFRSPSTKVMSQRHAELTWEDNRYPFLTDTNSTNGTAVERDGVSHKLLPANPYRLKDGDIITLGKQMAGSDDGTPHEPLSLSVTIVENHINTFAPSAIVAQQEASCIVVDSDSDDDSANAPPPSRQPNSNYMRKSSSSRSTVEVVEIDDEDSDASPQQPPRRRGGYGLDTPDLLDSDADDDLVIEDIDDESSSGAPLELDLDAYGGPEGFEPSWSRDASPEATQVYERFEYRQEPEFEPTHEDYDHPDVSDENENMSEPESPGRAGWDEDEVEVAAASDDEAQDPPASFITQAVAEAVAAVEHLIAAPNLSSPAPFSSPPAQQQQQHQPEPLQTFGDFIRSRSLISSEQPELKESYSPARQDSRLPSPESGSSRGASPPASEAIATFSFARAPFQASFINATRVLNDEPSRATRSPFARSPDVATRTPVESSPASTSPYRSLASIVVTSQQDLFETSSQASHLPSPSTSPRESLANTFGVPVIEPQSSDEEPMATASDEESQEELEEEEEEEEEEDDDDDDDNVEISDSEGSEIEDADADADATEWVDEEDDMAEPDSFLDQAEDDMIELDVDLELQAPDLAFATQAHVEMEDTASPEPEDLPEPEQLAEPTLTLVLPALPELELPAPASSTLSPELEPELEIESVAAPITRKRPLSTVDFETETDPIVAIEACAAAIATPIPTETSPEREVAPLPKRRKIEFGLKHLAISGALGFVAGTVVTVAGLASLESMFPQ
ncbi:hypothetical protein RQP46_004957 [Phenoliferia psychrophenolica]